MPSRTPIGSPTDPPTGAAPVGETGRICVARAESLTLFDTDRLHDVSMRLPLPGVVILVHGVNSDGEWYDAVEQGLCAGLNARLRRRDEHLALPGPAAGQLAPAAYQDEIDRDGFLNPEFNAQGFVRTEDSHSPVIRFRWGYKADSSELQRFGSGLYLNEQNYWGGGPFANGCSALPDLWGEGLGDDLLLFLHVQHLNPSDRPIYPCPPRPYFVLAAYRLARLVESIRRRQADVPITIVCHSQGNMVAMAAAFFGDTFADVTDPAGRTGRCVADTYVLCNPPYSLARDNFAEGWTQNTSRDPEGRTGRQTLEARQETLKAFFAIVGKQRGAQQEEAGVDVLTANRSHGYSASEDRLRHGLRGSTHGRVTLYCNPHDQVISATSVQGIGWRGMSAAEIDATGGQGVLTQRVYAQGWPVGPQGTYRYWDDHHAKVEAGSPDFWHPPSPIVTYELLKGLHANRYVVGKVLTAAAAPLLVVVTTLARMRINALPDKGWAIPIDAPALVSPFKPRGQRLQAPGSACDADAADPPAEAAFDEGYDPPGAHRNVETADVPADDPRRSVTRSKAGDGHTDAPAGDARSEAALRYEQHARLRMQARREELYAGDKAVEQEDKPETATPEYTAWRKDRIKQQLASSIDARATDHSTILTNPFHAERALAYDVAVGVSAISAQEMRRIRIEADWRLLARVEDTSVRRFSEYFAKATVDGQSAFDWANVRHGEASMPPAITNRREVAFSPIALDQQRIY